MPEGLDFTITAQDLASPIVDQVRSEFKGLSESVGQQTTESRNLTGIIKEERQEHRLRAFAIREGAGAVSELTNAMGGPAGLTKALQQGAGTLFEMDFALKALGGTIATLAIPLSVVIGTFILIKKGLDDDEEAYQKNIEHIKQLKQELGLIPVDSLEEVHQKNLKLIEDAGQLTFWERVRMSMHWQTMGLLSDESIKKEVQARQEDATVTGLKSETEWLDKTHKAALQKISDTDAISAALVKQHEIQGGSELVVAEETLKIQQQKLASLFNEGAATIQILEANNEILTTQKKISELRQDAASEKAASEMRKSVVVMSEATILAIRNQNTDAWAKHQFDKIDEVKTHQVQKLKEAEIQIGAQWETFFGVMDDGINSVAYEAVSQLNKVFGEAHSLLQIFLQTVLDDIAKIAANALASAAIGGILSLATGGALSFGAVFGKLTGGLFSSPSNSGGSSTPAPSVGNAVNGATVNIHFHGDTIDPNSVVRLVQQAVRQTGLPATQLLVDRRNQATYVQ